MRRESRPADCGATFDHAPHVYRDEGLVRACDGSISKLVTL